MAMILRAFFVRPWLENRRNMMKLEPSIYLCEMACHVIIVVVAK